MDRAGTSAAAISKLIFGPALPGAEITEWRDHDTAPAFAIKQVDGPSEGHTGDVARLLGHSLRGKAGIVGVLVSCRSVAIREYLACVVRGDWQRAVDADEVSHGQNLRVAWRDNRAGE